VIEEHNLNDIGKLFHNELPLYLHTYHRLRDVRLGRVDLPIDRFRRGNKRCISPQNAVGFSATPPYLHHGWRKEPAAKQSETLVYALLVGVRVWV